MGVCVVLTAGRPIPPVGQPRQGREGVAIVLLRPALDAWKVSGSVWKAWSPRIVVASLATGRRKKANKLFVISCYAPTFAATREEKDI